MTRRIHKTRLQPGQPNPLPYASHVLSVGAQSGELVAWYLTTVDDTKPPFTRMLQVVGTGWDLPPECTPETFIGTAQVGHLVWHVFDPSRDVDT